MAKEYTKEELRLLQLNELVMLLEFDRVCRKNNIKYSLDGGTLLGAIRHKGFIPWDDDIDVMMTADEYDKLFDAFEKDLDKTKFFFQDYHTDPGYRWGYGKMRLLGTEYVKAGHEKAKYKTGVCIDIFRLDPLPDKETDRKSFLRRMNIVRKIQYSSVGKYNSKSFALRLGYSILSVFTKDDIAKIETFLLERFILEKTENVINAYLPFPRKECVYGYPRSFFDEFCEVEFEGFHFLATKNYDVFLKMKYGDYMVIPPVEKQYTVMEPVELKMLDINIEQLRAEYRNAII